MPAKDLQHRGQAVVRLKVTGPAAKFLLALPDNARADWVQDAVLYADWEGYEEPLGPARHSVLVDVSAETLEALQAVERLRPGRALCWLVEAARVRPLVGVSASAWVAMRLWRTSAWTQTIGGLFVLFNTDTGSEDRAALIAAVSQFMGVALDKYSTVPGCGVRRPADER